MADTEAFYLPNCHSVVSENTGERSVYVRGRERHFINARHSVFLYPWKQDIPMLIPALLLLITLRAADYILTLFISLVALKRRWAKL